MLRRALLSARLALRATGLVLALSLAGGCGLLDDDDSTGGAAGPGSSPATGPGATTPTSLPPGVKPTSSAPTPTPTRPPAARPLNLSGPVGSLGPALLDPARSLRLELFIEAGAEPDRRTIPALQSTLADVAGKPVALPGAKAVPSSGPWTSDRIRQAGADLGAPQGAGEAGLRIMFLKGQLADDDSVLGIAVNASTAALFTDKIGDAAGLLGDRARFETAVGTHEVGHLLGLVGLVVGAGRADPQHPGHSPSKGSVMYWAVESDLIGTLLSGGPPTDFDADDRAEVAAIRQRGNG